MLKTASRDARLNCNNLQSSGSILRPPQFRLYLMYLYCAYVILPGKNVGNGGSISPWPITGNTLFYCDNLILLREHIPKCEH